MQLDANEERDSKRRPRAVRKERARGAAQEARTWGMMVASSPNGLANSQIMLNKMLWNASVRKLAVECLLSNTTPPSCKGSNKDDSISTARKIHACRYTGDA